MKRLFLVPLLFLLSLTSCANSPLKLTDLDLVRIDDPVEYRYAPAAGSLRVTSVFDNSDEQVRVVNEYEYSSVLHGNRLQWKIVSDFKSPELNKRLGFELETDCTGNIVSECIQGLDGEKRVAFLPGSKPYDAARGLFQLPFVPIVNTRPVSNDVVSDNSPLVSGNFRLLPAGTAETVLLGKTRYNGQQCYVLSFSDVRKALHGVEGKKVAIEFHLDGFMLVESETLVMVKGHASVYLLAAGKVIMKGDVVAEKIR